MTPTYKKSTKEDPENYRPVSLTSVLGNVMEQIILSTITQHAEEKKQKKLKIIYNTLFPLMRGFREEDTNKLCLENVISSEQKV